MSLIFLNSRLAAKCGRKPLLSIRACTFSSSGSDKRGDEKPAGSERSEETRGALKNFMKTKPAGQGLWAKLRKDLSPQNNNQEQKGQQQKPQDHEAKSSSPRQSTPRPFRRDTPKRDGPAPVRRTPTESNSTDGAQTYGGEAAGSERQSQRSMNPRSYQGRRASPGVGGDSRGGGGGGPRQTKPRRARERGGEGASRGSDGNIPPAIRAVLSEKYFEDLIKSKQTIDTRSMDGVDAFLANVYMDALKTKNNQVMTVIESDEFRRTLIPKPRPASELLATLVPPISSAEAGSEGHLLASEAWQVLSKNVFFNESEKHLICNSLAHKANKIITAATLAKESDLIFAADFRKGYEGIEEEKRRMLLAQDDGSASAFSDKEDTNWNVEAVVDEDDL